MFNLRLLQDLQLDNAQLRQQYYDFFLAGDYASAFQLIVANPSLNSQVLKKENLNALVDAILTLENYFQNGVTDYLQNELNRFELNIDELIYMNQFSPVEKYEINNCVIFNEIIYFCYVSPPIGTSPNNTTYWINLGLKGENGANSLGVNYVGEWIPTTPYLQKDMVVYDKKIYVAKVSNLNKFPNTSPNEWLLAVDFIPQGIYVSAIADPNWKDGAIWIKLLN
ncbi:MAG: hypothetical protein RR313_03615 [Anaerovoracaceae bacterium]